MLKPNPKSEYRKRPRGPKQNRAKINPKSGKSKTSIPIWARLGHSFICFQQFGFVSDFELRISCFLFESFEFVSDFEFRASNLLFLAPLRRRSGHALREKYPKFVFELLDMSASRITWVQIQSQAGMVKMMRVYLKLTQPLEAGTILWGFQRGRASPLVKAGVNTPAAKWLGLF
jgi:hypothetical protein